MQENEQFGIDDERDAHIRRAEKARQEFERVQARMAERERSSVPMRCLKSAAGYVMMFGLIAGFLITIPIIGALECFEEDVWFPAGILPDDFS